MIHDTQIPYVTLSASRPMKHLLLLVLALVTLVTHAAERRITNIRIEVQVVAIPEELALPIIGDLMAKEKIDPAYLTIQDLLTRGVAQLVGWPIVTTQSGQRAVIAAVDEIRYATKYSPPIISFTPDVDLKDSAKIKPKVDLTQIDAVPQEFETRNAGVTLEVEPVLAPDGKTISLNIVPQHVRLDRYEKATIEKEPAAGQPGSKVVVKQPKFEAMKVTTSIVLRNGERMLLGIFRTNDPPKHIEHFLLKAEAIPVD